MSEILTFEPKNGDNGGKGTKKGTSEAIFHDFSTREGEEYDLEGALEALLDAYDLVFDAIDLIPHEGDVFDALLAVTRALEMSSKAIAKQIDLY